jgi:hypothetical protein
MIGQVAVLSRRISDGDLAFGPGETNMHSKAESRMNGSLARDIEAWDDDGGAAPGLPAVSAASTSGAASKGDSPTPIKPKTAPGPWRRHSFYCRPANLNPPFLNSV